jgi:nondiscriminating glutamyl-tRNA synthetase
MSVRVRIPPSPTGLLHIGTARTALYNYLFAEKNKGVMVYRMEDTDRGRSKKEYEDNITEGLTKLGIIGTEGLHAGGDYGPYRQSERTDIYVGYLSELIEKDTAYFCFCSKERLEEMREQQRKDKKPPRYDGACAALNPAESKKRVEGGENAVIRLRVPANQDVSWHDSVRGEIRIHSGELDDFVIARKSDDPLYHLTVTVDDHDMQITHVIRGEDHITNTPKQILIYRAFGWVKPIFAHLPLILNEDKSKLSKRKNKVSVDDFLAEGYLVPALINFLALLGWNTSDEQEIFSMEELVDKFSLDRVHKGGAVFDLKKLDWINGEYIKKAIAENVEKFYNILEPFLKGQIPTDNPKRIQSMIAHPDFEGRFKKLIEIPEELKVFFDPLPDYSAALIAKEKFESRHSTGKPVTPQKHKN